MRLKILILLCMFSELLMTQALKTDSIIQLQSIDIKSEKEEYLITGLKKRVFDRLTLKLYKNTDLGAFLSANSIGYVKNYGPGSLSDLSIRGCASRHSAILWKGFSINPPNINISDLSLIQTGLFNSIEFVYGLNNAVYGNNSLVGYLNLDNIHYFKEPDTNVLYLQKSKQYSNLPGELNVNQSYGSFQTFSNFLNYKISTKRISSITSFTYNISENNYSYRNDIKGGIIEKAKNAGYLKNELIQDIGIKINNTEIVNMAFWYSNSDRSVMGSLSSKTGAANQQDESLRYFIEWKKTSKKNLLFVKASQFRSELNYKDPLININSYIYTINNNAVIENKAKLTKNFSTTCNIQFIESKANIEEYREKKKENTSFLFGKLDYNAYKELIKVSLSFKKAILATYKNPTTYSLGAIGQISVNLTSRINISQNYNKPNLNDLYWQPGGNPDLAPEKSISYEGGVDWMIIKNNIDKFSISYYNITTENWIQWVPGNYGYFSAQNVKKVNCSGLELANIIKFTTGIFKIQLTQNYNYTKSICKKSNYINDESENKQLIYIPINTANAGLNLIYKTYNLHFITNYTGKRYSSTDNIYFLPSFITGDLKLGKEFESNNIDFNIGIDINNIWNEEYNLIRYYPMPGRYFGFNINITIK